jgi:acylphosphatase
MKQVHVRISGHVQGVWYRASTKQKAEELGITGWVKNTSDGAVEAVFAGEEEVVDAMISWCQKGPRLAKVTNVEMNDQPYSGEFEGFTIKY